MPIVELPDGTELEFPDGMADAAMQRETAKYWNTQKAEISAAYDTGVQPSALVSRQAQEMMPPSIRETMNRGAQAPLQRQITQDAQRGLTRWLLGSTSEAVLMHAHANVLLVPVSR
jgi:hypothetical protein